MSKRGVGLVLVLTFAVAVAAGTVFQDFRSDTSISREQTSSDALNRAHQAAQLALASLRGAQAAYVAADQSQDFWVKRASELAAQIEASLTELQTASTSAEAKSHYDAAMSALGVLNSLDQKARDDLQNGNRTLAAEIVFADTSIAAERLATELTAAQWAESASHHARLAEGRRLRLGTTSAGIAAMLVMLVVVATRRRSAIAAGEPVVAALPGPEGPGLHLSEEPRFHLSEEPRANQMKPRPNQMEPRSNQMEPRANQMEPGTFRSREPRVNLSDAAQLCVDFARVLDGQDVPPLLKRACEVLDAKGLVLWVADPAGAFLRPSLAHGYSDKVLQRLGPLQTSADNVTSLAFRSLQAQSLGGQAKGSSSAIAVPLITSTGCIGVLSAEVAQAGSSAETLSLARIFAAQLATLVSPGDAAGGQQAAHA
jgi:hypothetical protein